MTSRKERLCPGCGFPSRRGVVPIIWRTTATGMEVYCSVGCLEKHLPAPFPEPFRAAHIAAEDGVE